MWIGRLTGRHWGGRRYAPTEDLWVITCYFNPGGYRTKLANYHVFAAALRRSGLRLLTIECAFGAQPFSLAPSPHVLRVSCADVMWQKERLLNLAIAALPDQCAKVALLDCDVLFENNEWAVLTARLLDDYPLVQPFERVFRLPRGHHDYAGEGEHWRGFAAVHRVNPGLLLTGNFALHGHTGFAWAARRELLDRHGLYDACIAGSGDHLIAHAAVGDLGGSCVGRVIRDNPPFLAHFTAWGGPFHAQVGGRIAAVPGALLHLWHGETAHRRYVDRNVELAGFGFDPATDLRLGDSGCWEWSAAKPALRQWAVDYFGQRREDG